MLKDELQKQINEALKAGEDLRVSTLRLLVNALHNEEINLQKELDKDQEIAIVKRQLKQREEAIEALRQAQGKLTNSSEATIEARIGQEKQEAEILKIFLPVQMADDELGKIVDETISGMGSVTQGDFGRVMGQVMAKVKGKADGNQVSEMVKSKLK